MTGGPARAVASAPLTGLRGAGRWSWAAGHRSCIALRAPGLAAAHRLALVETRTWSKRVQNAQCHHEMDVTPVQMPEF